MTQVKRHTAHSCHHHIFIGLSEGVANGGNIFWESCPKDCGGRGNSFWLLTVVSGGRALFGNEEARAAVGNAVPFVLWFNFVAGFAYVIAGIGLLSRHHPAVWLSISIFVTTFLVMLIFGIHMSQGGAYEMRTVGAMILRVGVWAAISLVAWKYIRSAAKR